MLTIDVKPSDGESIKSVCADVFKIFDSSSVNPSDALNVCQMIFLNVCSRLDLRESEAIELSSNFTEALRRSIHWSFKMPVSKEELN